ncbi:MAG: DMT family transporter [Muribaculaceae bacterium]|nr:DMT family transporter [Muribaculaceae bacterium]
MNNTTTVSSAPGQPGGKSKKLKSLLIGNLLALSTAICWGLNEPANKALIPDWISASGVALSRIFGATLIVWLISIFIKPQKIQKGDWKSLAWAGVMMVGFIYVFSLAFNTASAIDIAIILTFQPMLVVLINAIFKHEKVSSLEIVGMLIAFGGALLVILAGGNLDGGRLLGDFFAVVCSITYAAYLVIIEGPSKRYGTINLMKWVFLFTAIISIPLIFTLPAVPRLFESVGGTTHWLPIALLLFIIVFPTVYCYIVTPPAIKLIGSELLSFYQYLVPVITCIVSVIFKIDTFHWYQPVSFVIIVAGVMLANKAKATAPKKSN